MKQLLTAATATLLFFTACDFLNTKQVTIREKSNICKLDFYDLQIFGIDFASLDSVQSYKTTYGETVYLLPGLPLPTLGSIQTVTAVQGVSKDHENFETFLILKKIE